MYPDSGPSLIPWPDQPGISSPQGKDCAFHPPHQGQVYRPVGRQVASVDLVQQALKQPNGLAPVTGVHGAHRVTKLTRGVRYETPTVRRLASQ
jgi:hypothetical protein